MSPAFIARRGWKTEGELFMKLHRLIPSLALASALMLGSTQMQAQTSAVSGKFEIFSWWAGDEAPAKDALIKLFEQKYPNVEVIDATVAGGSGDKAKAVLQTRMQNNQPPDTF